MSLAPVVKETLPKFSVLCCFLTSCGLTPPHSSAWIFNVRVFQPALIMCMDCNWLQYPTEQRRYTCTHTIYCHSLSGCQIWLFWQMELLMSRPNWRISHRPDVNELVFIGDWTIWHSVGFSIVSLCLSHSLCCWLIQNVVKNQYLRRTTKCLCCIM